MGKIKDKDIYPRFEFRLSHEEKEWLNNELKYLKEKFTEEDCPPIGKNALIISALRYGIRQLKSAKKIKT